MANENNIDNQNIDNQNLIKGVNINGTAYKIDYDALANRPFGIESRETYLEETEDLEFRDDANDYGQYYGDCIISEEDVLPIVGEDYIVTWDGTEYLCRCWNSGYSPAMGDYRFNNYPFYIAFSSYGSTSGYIWTNQIDNYHTIKIDHVIRSRITPNVLPEYLRFGVEKRELILAYEQNTQFTEDENSVYKNKYTMYSQFPLPVSGLTYVVDWDGTKYDCVAYMNSENKMVLGDQNFTSYPFFILFNTDNQQVEIRTSDTSPTHSYCVEEFHHGTLDAEYMPYVYYGRMRVSYLELLNMFSNALNLGIHFSDRPSSASSYA